ncbi:MAG: hypothetical protein JRN06_08960 [Nitrososphaerota archaeon]|nr:hypothetical protein [Nitrososphaerota archaeon]MDG7024566.1 hypothetical protein [Nitrososphaerota archaeon]
MLFISLGAYWLTIRNDPFSGSFAQFTMLCLFGMVGSRTGPTHSSLASTLDFDAYVDSALPPIIAGSWELVTAIIAVVLGLLLGLAAFFKWWLTFPSGLLSISAGVLSIAGVSSTAPAIVASLSEWPGFVGETVSLPVGISFGPYVTIAGGVVLVAAYLLSKENRSGRAEGI